jgi:hypothetical protein
MASGGDPEPIRAVVSISRPPRYPGQGSEIRRLEFQLMTHSVGSYLRLTQCERVHHLRIVWRGDSHYGHVEAMEWAEDNPRSRPSLACLSDWSSTLPLLDRLRRRRHSSQTAGAAIREPTDEECCAFLVYGGCG